jgi:hypothetical protein
MSGHTPGPWVQVHKIIDADSGRLGKDNTERICIMDDGPSESEREANAILIAQAPRMLAALEKCRAVLDNQWMKTQGKGITDEENAARHAAQEAIQAATDDN